MLLSSRASGDNFIHKSFEICKYEIIAFKTVSRQHAKKILKTHNQKEKKIDTVNTNKKII